MVTYYRYVVLHDYIIQGRSECDPFTEACFLSVCDSASGEECANNTEEDTTYYKLQQRNAKNIPFCYSQDENCDMWTCSPDEKDCYVTLCDETTALAEDTSCNDPVSYTAEHPPEEMLAEEDTENQEDSVSAETEYYESKDFSFGITYPVEWMRAEMSEARGDTDRGILLLEQTEETVDADSALITIIFTPDITQVTHTSPDAPQDIIEYGQDPMFTAVRPITFNGETAFIGTLSADASQKIIVIKHKQHIYQIRYDGLGDHMAEIDTAIQSFVFLDTQSAEKLVNTSIEAH